MLVIRIGDRHEIPGMEYSFKKKKKRKKRELETNQSLKPYRKRSGEKKILLEGV